MPTGQTIYANEQAMEVIEKLESPGQSPSGVIIELAQKAGVIDDE